MKLENIVFAVAAKIDVDRSFVFEYVVCRQIQAILLKHFECCPSCAHMCLFLKSYIMNSLIHVSFFMHSCFMHSCFMHSRIHASCILEFIYVSCIHISCIQNSHSFNEDYDDDDVNMFMHSRIYAFIFSINALIHYAMNSCIKHS